MNIRFWLSHPNLIIARIKYYIFEKLNPDKPWMCPGTIEFAQQNFMGSVQALEFGSGRSTKWFSKLTQKLISIEDSFEWYQQVKSQLQNENINNVDYQFIPLEHPQNEPEQKEYNPIPKYISTLDNLPDQSLNFVIVDGHYRTNCIRYSIPKIAPKGYLLVDDTNLWPSIGELPIPKTWVRVNDSTNGLKRCMIWQAP